MEVYQLFFFHVGTTYKFGILKAFGTISTGEGDVLEGYYYPHLGAEEE